MVVTPIRPVVAPAGTVTVSCESESTENSVAATFLKVTIVVWVRLTPVITTDVPGEAPAGLKPTFGLVGADRFNIILIQNDVIGPVGGDHVCRATSGNYRLDTATARDFLKNYVTYRKL